ncbi:MAG: hypothetical protein Q9162_006510 [Coniocarpon cinnabarinum]
MANLSQGPSAVKLLALERMSQDGQDGFHWHDLEIYGNIDFQLNWFDPSIGQITNINIQQTNFHDLALAPIQASAVTLVDNKNLTELPSPLESCTDLYLAGNTGLNLSLPSLEFASSVTLLDLDGISLPGLSRVSNNLTVANSTVQDMSFDNLTALGSITLSGNTQLGSVSLPFLRDIHGYLELVDNGAYPGVTNSPKGTFYFNELETVDGDINITGPFDGMTTENLKYVGGNTYLSSSNDISDTCKTFSSGDANKSIGNGSVNCISSDEYQPDGSKAATPISVTRPHNSSLAGGAIAGIVVGSVALVATICTTYRVLCRRKKWFFHKRRGNRNSWHKPEQPAGRWQIILHKIRATELPGVNARDELPGISARGELQGIGRQKLAAGDVRPELPDSAQPAELPDDCEPHLSHR